MLISEIDIANTWCLLDTTKALILIFINNHQRKQKRQNTGFILLCHCKMTRLQFTFIPTCLTYFLFLFLFQMTRLPHIFFLLLLYYYCTLLCSSTSEPTQNVSPKLSSLRQSITQNARMKLEKQQRERNMKKVIFNTLLDLFSE